MPTPPGRGRYHLTFSARFVAAYVERASEMRTSHPSRAAQLTDFVNRLDSLCGDPHSARHWRYDVSPVPLVGRREYVVEETLSDEEAGRGCWAAVQIRYSVSDDDRTITLEDLAIVPRSSAD